MPSLPCPPEHWSRFSALLDQAMELPEQSRPVWLDELRGTDETLRPWLARVLASPAGLDTRDFMAAPQPPADIAPELVQGDLIGPYRLEAPLGEGGMGRVWRASRQDDGPVREVALKLPHADLLTGPFRARFRRERDVLAGLSHPHIAALFDAGVGGAGHPYLALELVAGKPITDHCRDTAAPLDRRIELVCQVLAALGYAHGRLIVHRDIKPSNVLVTSDGEVKLLDFGIAKLLDDSEAAAPGLTQPAARLATPGYAAPEQMEGAPVTVAVDLFAAGVLLFELCTGRRPPRLLAHGNAAPLASASLDPACLGGLDAASLRRRLRGDLDAVIARALALDPAQRYGSADAFARDLRRWRDGLPVAARRTGLLERSAKFIRRNRLAVALAGCLALALAGGLGGVAWQARRAEREAARALATRDFLIGLFKQGDAASGGKRLDTMTALAMLDAGVTQADAAFAHDPETEIELMATLGSIYDWAEEPDRARRAWSRRLELATARYGEDDTRVIDAALTLANSEVTFLRDEQARALLERIRAPILARYGPASLQRAQWLQARALSLRAVHGGREEALADSAEAVAILRTHFPHDPSLHDALAQLFSYQYDDERYAESLATIEAMRANDVAQHDFGDGDDIAYHAEAATRLERLGRFADAETYLEWTRSHAERLLGKESMWTIFALTNRAQMASLRGDRAVAGQVFQQALAIDQHRAAASGLSTTLRRAYGAALAREGRAADAIPVLEQALRETELHGHDEQNLRRTRGMLGDAYDQAGRVSEARALLRAARDDWMRYGPADGIGQLGARERWARFLFDHGEQQAAAAEFAAVMASAHGRPMAASSLAQAGLARVALAQGAWAQADALSGSALASLDQVRNEFDVRARVELRLVRAESLAAAGHPAQARALATAARDDAAMWDAADSLQLARAERLRVRLDGPPAEP